MLPFILSNSNFRGISNNCKFSLSYFTRQYRKYFFLTFLRAAESGERVSRAALEVIRTIIKVIDPFFYSTIFCYLTFPINTLQISFVSPLYLLTLFSWWTNNLYWPNCYVQTTCCVVEWGGWGVVSARWPAHWAHPSKISGQRKLHGVPHKLFFFITLHIQK